MCIRPISRASSHPHPPLSLTGGCLFIGKFKRITFRAISQHWQMLQSNDFARLSCLNLICCAYGRAGWLCPYPAKGLSFCRCFSGHQKSTFSSGEDGDDVLQSKKMHSPDIRAAAQHTEVVTVLPNMTNVVPYSGLSLLSLLSPLCPMSSVTLFAFFGTAWLGSREQKA